jgi:alkanesulfonate monooxygenase SsuD/methylene tetrahydromethanopterin reductase-like flavin-dependent oxidoreductase (luciferase family)
VPVAERGARADEGIPIQRALWRGEAPPSEGRFFRIPPTRLDPVPARPGGLPIWIGGRSDAALRRAARLGDGYLGYFLDAEGFRRRMATIRGAREAPIAGALMAFARVDARREQALERASARLGAMYSAATAPAAERFGVVGSPDECAAKIAELRAAGVEHLIFSPIAAPGELEEQLGRLAEAAA